MEFFRAVGGLGLGSRLKRLSDVCMSEVKDIYSSVGVEFEPKWFPLFRLLTEKTFLTVTEAADLLGMTHPHISQLAKEMSGAKLIVFQANQRDKRSRIFTLTEKGHRLIKELEPVWDEIADAVAERIRSIDPEFLNRLEQIERSFQTNPLSKVVKGKLKDGTTKKCRVLDYSPGLRKDFERLNREWLEKYFSVEAVDRRYFANPEREILKKGGEIFFAEWNGEVVGTCSLLVDGDQLEMGKMAVTESARGKGIGELLAKEAIRRAKKTGAKKLMLVTNSRLIPAVSLYEKLGFRETFRGQHPKYKRGDLLMEKNLQ